MSPKPVFITASGSGPKARVTAAFMAQHAIAPEDSILYTPPGDAEREQFETMLARGVIKRAAQGYYWLDTVAYNRDDRSRQMMTGYVAAAIAVVLAGVLVIFYRG